MFWKKLSQKSDFSCRCYLLIFGWTVPLKKKKRHSIILFHSWKSNQLLWCLVGTWETLSRHAARVHFLRSWLILNSSVLNLLFAGWYGFPLFLFAPLSAHAHDRTHSVFVGSSKQVIKGVCVCVDKGTKSRTIAHTAAPLFSFKGHCERVRECVYFAHKGSSPDLHECVCKKAKSCVCLLLKALNSLFALLWQPLSLHSHSLQSGIATQKSQYYQRFSHRKRACLAVGLEKSTSGRQRPRGSCEA